jgi:general L-amino acid transport system substrate-binding protein
MAVEFVPTTGQTRFTALASGEIDFSRATRPGPSRAMSTSSSNSSASTTTTARASWSAELGVTSAKELDGATVCIQTGTTTELNLADFFRANNISYEPVPIETNAEGQQQYLAGACDAYTTDASGLAATRATFENPGDHVILPEIISKEPLGPLVRHGDNEWGDIVRWTLNALIAAEEYGVTSANVDELANGTDNPRSTACSAPRATWARCSASTTSGPCAPSRPAATTARSSRRTSVRTPRSGWRAG